MRIAIVGGGIFGLTAALELASRGHTVVVHDRGPIPHPLAESTDISKVVRMDYGADTDYSALGEAALDGWRRWNAEWTSSCGALFHETGVLFLSRISLESGSFEYESYRTLVERGHPLDRLDAAAIAARFPAYASAGLVDGYFNPYGGWVESGRVIAKLAQLARAANVAILESEADFEDLERGDLVIVCAGAWAANVLPDLATAIVANGQPVFHMQPADPRTFAADRFPVFGVDISRTGYYGFPANADGIVKIANHGEGVSVAITQEGDAYRSVHPAQEEALRAFLANTFPELARAPIVRRYLCVYADTIDGHFWIDRHPLRHNVVVATGGSGHAFKFAPVLGPLIADIALGEHHPLAHKFRWRTELVAPISGDAARNR